MKFLSLLPLVLFSASALAQSPADLPGSTRREVAIPVAPKAPWWSVVGKWHCTHPAWTDTVTIVADGTFSRENGEAAPAGRWTLGSLGDHVILVLAWNNWPAETVTMVTPDVFRGPVRGESEYGEMEMHRLSSPSVQAGVATVETRTWRQGEPPVRLIRKEEGICALSLVTGHFLGGGEVVKVYIGDDGFWYLGGQSGTEGVAAQCIVVRFPAKPSS